LDRLDSDLQAEDLFADWLGTNYLDSSPEVHDPKYTYTGIDLPRPTTAEVHVDYPIEMIGSTEQLGADYIRLPGDEELHIHFSGQRETALLTAQPYGGQYAWWSNQADESLTTLTRRFDLSEVEGATLTYWTWYDIERYYDWAKVEASADGGQSWHILSTPSGIDAAPYSGGDGWSYTGKSGGWIQEKVDLSEYQGQQVLVRFPTSRTGRSLERASC
jgi:hypothetical protein